MGVMFEEIGRELYRQSAVKKAFELLQEKIDFLSEVIKLALGRSQTLDSIFERVGVH
ncbi:ATP-dependent helicase [Haemophilus influenzae]|uniref:ATP-dependent helicase n=1 Tax=Haemophilus influenzae TaxID=727 RepID=A0A2X1PPC1_HAEIF|nr:ATP-dependent helicase [Haemophilus influenzae]